MGREIRPASAKDVRRVKDAERLLREARDLLREAGAPETLERVRDALKSCGGAVRHVESRFRRNPTPQLTPEQASRETRELEERIFQGMIERKA